MSLYEGQQPQTANVEQVLQQLIYQISSLTVSIQQQAHDTTLQSLTNPNGTTSNNTGNVRTLAADSFRITDPIKIQPTFTVTIKQLLWWLETAKNTLNNFKTFVSP